MATPNSPDGTTPKSHQDDPVSASAIAPQSQSQTLASKTMTANLSSKELDDLYEPTDDEAFMNERQQNYFRRKLLAWRDELLQESRDTLLALQNDSDNHTDIADRASSETDKAIELRARDRQRKLIAKIDAALMRLDEGNYGYCEETGEPISLKRLKARPIATLSIEAQERHEKREKIYRED